MTAKKLKQTKQGKDHLKLLPDLLKKQKKGFINELNNNINLLQKYPAKMYLNKMKEEDQKILKGFFKKHILQKDSKNMIQSILKNLAGPAVGAGAGLALSQGGALGLAGAFGAISIPPFAIVAVGASLGYTFISLSKGLFRSGIMESIRKFVKNAEDVKVTVEQVLNLLIILKETYKKVS